MAARKVAVISINLNAGTAQFIADMDSARAKIGQFGQSSKQSMIASSAALRELEGNFANNNRAIARFLSTSLGLGPVLQAAFPLVGGLAFGTMLFELGGKVKEFFDSIAQAPEKIKGAFRELTAPMKLSNDELQLANDRLSNEIAKLEGRRQNTLKIALDEARVAADKLADSLNKDLSQLNKILTEQNVGAMRQFFGEAGTKDIKEEFGGKTGFGGLAGDIAEINRAGQARIDQAHNLKDADAARLELNANLARRYAVELVIINKKLAEAQKLATPKPVRYKGGGFVPMATTVDFAKNEAARIEELKGAQRALQEQIRAVGLQATNTGLTERKEALETERANELLSRPFEERMKALQANLEASRLKLAVVGKDEAFQVQAKASGEALKIIEEVNKSLEKQHVQLTAAQKDSIQAVVLKTAETESQTTWNTKLDEATKKINDQMKGQQLLTAAIGEGYTALKAANVEIELMSRVGVEAYNDQTKAAQNALLRRRLEVEYDAKNLTDSNKKADALGDQIELERILAKIQMEGAEAIRLQTFQFELQRKIKDGAQPKEIAALKDQFRASKELQDAQGIAKIDQQIAGINRIIAAQVNGAEAVRKAQLEAKYEQMRLGGGKEAEIQRTRLEDELRHEEEVRAAALKRGQEYKTQKETLSLEAAEMERMSLAEKSTFEWALSKQRIEQEYLKILVEESLAHRRAIDGVRAFFIEMQKQVKSAADIIYESLTSSIDKASDEFAKFVTRQKTSFGKMFQSIGEEALKNVFKAGIQSGLGAIGKHFGLTGKPDGSSATSALWVRIATATGTAIPSGNPGSGGPLGLGRIPVPGSTATGPDGSSGNPFYVVAIATGAPAAPSGSNGGSGSFLGALFGSLAGASLQKHAGGGGTSPAGAYWVGEQGPEILLRSSGTVLSNAESRRAVGGGGGNHFYNIDARGTDPLLTEQRVRTAIISAHDNAVGTSVRVSADRLRRGSSAGHR